MGIESYQQEYSQTHPQPALPQHNPWRDARAWLLAFVIACGILVSAFRTQGAFADIARADRLLPWLRSIESIAAALVTELGLVVFMVERVRRERDKSPAGWVYSGLAVCFIMSATSNFDQGIKARFPATSPDWLSWGTWHVLILSAGIPVIVALAGEALGQHLAGVLARNEELHRDWRAEMDEWYRRLNIAWAARQRKQSASPTPLAELSLKEVKVHSGDGHTEQIRNGTSETTLASHLSLLASKGILADTFRRRDVEAWLGVRTTQAHKVIRYGQTQGLIEALPGNRYRLLPNGNGKR